MVRPHIQGKMTFLLSPLLLCFSCPFIGRRSLSRIIMVANTRSGVGAQGPHAGVGWRRSGGEAITMAAKCSERAEGNAEFFQMLYTV